MRNHFKIIYLLLIFILLNSSIKAQLSFIRDNQVIVLNDLGDTLENPWAGGFNSVQFSEIDLNLDGIKDLFVFDKAGGNNRISTFINYGTANQVDYHYDPYYIQFFPKLISWALLRDYNCDGKMDIFTYYNGGMSVYKNTSTSQLNFTIEPNYNSIYIDQVSSDYNPDSLTSPSNPTGAPKFINLYISSTDVPAIDDIDGDGDLDVLTFSILGSYVEYHKNLSIERYGTCDSLLFQLRNNCWGFFREMLSGNDVMLYDTCSWNNYIPEKLKSGNKHSGSTLLTLDMDANNSKELVLGDVSFNNFTMLTNGDTTSDFTASSMVARDTAFPQNTLSTLAVDINVFPGGYYLDVNNDSVKDLIATPNCYNGCKNSNNVWYYRNDNTNNTPDFNFVSNAFLQDGMIEVGEGAHPVFFDYNSDGLMDIIIGSYGNFNPAVGPLLYESGLWLYENIGTATNPAYQFVTNDYTGISTMNLDISGGRPTLGLTPTFGDLDDDGDLDMLMGDYNGHIHYFRNNAGAGNPAIFTIAAPEYLGIDVGNNATPLLYDLNNDLLLDLIIGNKTGTFSYYQNTGTSSIPNFSFITDSLGKVTTQRFYDYAGYSNPIIINELGVTKLLSGSLNGYLYEFSNIDGNLNGTFTVDSSYLNIWEGVNSSLSIADVTNDGKLDMLIGNYAGGAAFYKGDSSVSIQEKENIKKVNIYPNPTNGMINIDLSNNDLTNGSIAIINLLGEIIYYKKISTSKINVDIGNYPAGVYLVKFSNNSSNKVFKVIKK